MIVKILSVSLFEGRIVEDHHEPMHRSPGRIEQKIADWARWKV
jgi:hypothetical protein